MLKNERNEAGQDQRTQREEEEGVAHSRVGWRQKTGRKSTNCFSRDLPNPEIKPGSPVLWANFLRLSHHGSPSLV